MLKWSPKLNIYQALDSILNWEKSWINGDDMKELTLMQIHDFEEIHKR